MDFYGHSRNDRGEPQNLSVYLHNVANDAVRV